MEENARGVYEGRLRAAENMLKKVKPKKMLDIGCRDFGMQERFYKYSEEVIAMDIDFEQVDKLKKMDNVVKLCGDGCELPFKDNEFDGLLCTEVIEHVSDEQKLLQECSRVLKQGGYLIMTTPNRKRIANFLRKIIGKEYTPPYNVHSGPCGRHLREYTPKELTKDIAKHGFEVAGWEPTYLGISFEDKLPIGTLKFARLFIRYNVTLAVLARKK